jgi:catechol 2,3-dioxygenase-like lactoylglutathione lyase family enzyme
MRIHHIAMRSPSPARLETFYARVLGLDVVQRDGARSVWLRAGDTLVMIEQADEREPPIPNGSMELVAFGIRVADVDRYRAALADAKVRVEAETAYTLYVRDPDGRRVGLSHYPGE